ncbi:hypothetical protein CUC08_Gglean010777 [Alternaria sp. MG1]|nr:hypothetical protein CUC08_Gglean010777 [Alternaria sp. MG1]
MSDAGHDPTLSDDEVNGQAAPAENADEGTPLNTVEENGLEDDEDDLFAEDAPASPRKLDDAELDSGDDEGRTDRVRAPEAVEEVEQQTFAYMDADLARHPVPEPTDNELYLLKVPRFLSFEDKAFDHKTFQPPSTDHHSKVAASEHFSAYDTAMTTVRWRRSPSNNALLQSNARILRWSDGSLTLQLATDPTVQYDIDANTLAPPQVNPKIPTPTAVRDEKNGKTSSKKESYTYLVAPYEEANVMRVTNKLTASLNVVPTSNTKDAALEKLQNDLAKVAAKGRDDADQAISFIDVNEDPELRRQREEATFKEKQRQLRAREKHEERQRERANRTMGRSGGRAAGGGLDIDGLEDRATRKQGKKRGGLQYDLSDDEDLGGPRRNREDSYESEDGFVVNSDEEPEIVSDDDDPDEGMAPSPKRARGGVAADDDDDDEVVVSRTKRRRVVDDDDDDE